MEGVPDGLGELSWERGISREGREEDVGVEIRGIRRPVTEDSRGEAIVDILLIWMSVWIYSAGEVHI